MKTFKSSNRKIKKNNLTAKSKHLNTITPKNDLKNLNTSGTQKKL